MPDPPAALAGELIMDEEKDSSRGFRVTDRRRFSDEGEAREVSDAAEPSAPADQAGSTEEVPPQAESHAWSDEPVNFSTFLLGLSTQALLHLGEIEDPGTGHRERDLGAAKHVIDILGILRDKTKGNLEQGEERLLDAVLYDLRMKYVELARGSKEGA
jgi:Domain of unknown function (DUF1844)